MKPLAIVTGADGGMGSEITRALALAGYRVVMACHDLERAARKQQLIRTETGNPDIEVRPIDLASLASVRDFARQVLAEGQPIARLMNNAGTMETARHTTEDGLERTVSVNYVGPYLLTRPDFFTFGCRGSFWRIPIYSNTKLALTLFTLDLARRVEQRGIVVHAADPGIVSTDMIRMQMWFDPLTDIFFRPCIRTPRQGAATAIGLLLGEEAGRSTGTFNASCRPKQLSDKYLHHPKMEELWQLTEERVKPFLD